MTMEKRNLIENGRTPAFAKQSSVDEIEDAAVGMFKKAEPADFSIFDQRLDQQTAIKFRRSGPAWK